MNTKSRPLSPHLQVYRPQLTSVLSILHRGTGLVLALGAVLIAAWFWGLGGGESSYARVYAVLNSTPGKVLLLAWTACTFYHLCNGIRHLLWDIGHGFELSAVYRSGWLVVAATVVLTLLVWLL